MADKRFYVVAVDVRSTQGEIGNTLQFRSRYPSASVGQLDDGRGLAFTVPLLARDEDAARDEVRSWAQECFAGSQYEVAIRAEEPGVTELGHVSATPNHLDGTSYKN